MESYEKKALLLASISIMAVITVFLILLQLFQSYTLEIQLSLITVIASGTAFYLSLVVIEKQEKRLYILLRNPWFYVSSGIGLWLAAETIWLVYVILYFKPIKISLADITWLLGYLFISIGLYIKTKILAANPKKHLLLILPLILGITLALLEYTISTSTVLRDITEIILDNIYVVLDLILMALSLECIFYTRKNDISISFIAISLGFATLAISDLPYFIIGGYYPGNILDLLYIIGYIIIATGIYIYNSELTLNLTLPEVEHI